MPLACEYSKYIEYEKIPRLENSFIILHCIFAEIEMRVLYTLTKLFKLRWCEVLRYIFNNQFAVTISKFSVYLRLKHTNYFFALINGY